MSSGLLVVRLITPEERPRWNELVSTHHYLENATLVGEQFCYVAEYQGTWLAPLGWAAPARHLRPRDAWVGRSKEQLPCRRHFFANNARFCILADRRQLPIWPVAPWACAAPGQYFSRLGQGSTPLAAISSKYVLTKHNLANYHLAMAFLGRKRELELLQNAWRSGRAAFIPIYGRRRVGKSELILHFMTGKGGLYFTGKRAPGAAQLQEFLEAAARAVNEPLLAQSRISTWKAALEAVMERRKGPGKWVLALDEFQWVAEASPELPSVLQELWDRSWSRSGRVMLLLCGSYLGFMEREVLGARSPLFGRRTAQILLRPFDYIEAAAFHPGYATADQARVYGICGGVPAYLLAFDDRRSVEQNIMSGLLDDSAALAREPEFLLREELRDLVPYHAVLTALARGKSSPTLLAQSTGIDVRGLSYYLNTLIELGYAQRRHPLTHGKPQARQVRYALEDPLLRFWFRFVFPHQSLLRALGPARGFAELIQPELAAYLGRCFERLCRESLPRLYAREGVRAPFTVGEYWDKQVQIDVVGVREDNWTDLGECKWGSVASAAALVEELETKVRTYPNPRNATIGRRLFVGSAKANPKSLPPNVRVHTLADLYALESRAWN